MDRIQIEESSQSFSGVSDRVPPIGIGQMSERAPASPPDESASGLESTDIRARDVHAVFHGPELQAIPSRSSHLFCFTFSNKKPLDEISRISEGY
jgi:hypothetical protein